MDNLDKLEKCNYCKEDAIARAIKTMNKKWLRIFPTGESCEVRIPVCHKHIDKGITEARKICERLLGGD